MIRSVGAVLLALALAVAGPEVRAEHLIVVVATRGSVHQPFGEAVVKGVEIAVARINAAGGVLGDRLRVVAWNEDCTRARAAQVAAEIAPLKPAVVIGHLCAGAALAATPIYSKGGVLLIAPGVRHPALTSAASGSLVLRLAGRDDRFAADAARFVAARYPGVKVALIADRTRQARTIAGTLAVELGRAKVPIGSDERIESGEKSYDAVANRIRASGAGVIIMPAQPIELGVLVSSVRRAGVTAPVVGSDILAVPSVVPTAEREGERLVLMLPWTGAEEATPNTQALVEIQSKGAVMRAEAAVEVWADAAARASSTASELVSAAARAGAARTVVGPLRFDEAGDAVVPSYVPHVWTGGRWHPLVAPTTQKADR